MTLEELARKVCPFCRQLESLLCVRASIYSFVGGCAPVGVRFLGQGERVGVKPSKSSPVDGNLAGGARLLDSSPNARSSNAEYTERNKVSWKLPIAARQERGSRNSSVFWEFMQRLAPHAGLL